ncbi:hypothetical protein SA20RB_200 [Escherichia phage vB_EcoM_SA20RB]|uniref:Phage protein n=1 Tax=Citrobacter phage vB_CroM_CrRp10 TaxID=2079276 RepID=A0A2K9VBL5_9CAUD|nr:hypothetical protein KMB91_gp157 [Citrobacter phage vB_CroM_CrRp10]EFW2851106.1 hypothetical protein [Shigella sonnei]QXV75316.1 hypothetical protein bas44_0040 [Escherichia phage AdolfPortmann]QXV78749.1 hypothetical protein bas39_0041 [Escherichia phage FriedrichMiescher]QXV79028.1 hypothetical protein bas41_0039 [Escherichia phage FriedrichZschokke]QZI79451.1 hypothetical protein 101117BS1_176 [Escherichia phage vB_EcoM-101117BS1]UIU28146.1 hypothetical protein SA20RB_200 [Escherichia p
MKFFLGQTVELKGIGIPGLISKVLPAFKLGDVQVKDAYIVSWVDGNEDLRMGDELSPIYGLKELV